MQCTFQPYNAGYFRCSQCRKVILDSLLNLHHQCSGETRDFKAASRPCCGKKEIIVSVENVGYGDAIVAAWSGYSPRPRLVFHATGQKRILLEMLGQTVVDRQPTMVTLNALIDWELREPEHARAQMRHTGLGLTGAPQRPICKLADERKHWASFQHDSARPFILLFPNSTDSRREWGAANFIEVYERLTALGNEVIILTQYGDDTYKGLRHLAGQDWRNVASLMLQATLVIAVDSAPANLSGTLDIPTLALMNPTLPKIFEHTPSVECLIGNLTELPVSEVVNRALEILAKRNR
jgi:hypothetical protein